MNRFPEQTLSRQEALRGQSGLASVMAAQIQTSYLRHDY